MGRILRCTIQDFLDEPKFFDLIQEYEDESSIEGLPKCRPNFELYLALEKTGYVHAVKSVDDTGAMTGFMVVVINEMPHYGAVAAMTESIFVSKSHRKTGAGIKLLMEARKIAVESGAKALMVSAPLGGKFDSVLHRMKFTCTNVVYTQIL